MKRILPLIILTIIVFVSACNKTNLKPEQKDFFIKLFGSSSLDYGVDLKQTNDGYVLLSTTTTVNNGTDILLIKTNEYGNEQWSITYGNTLNDYANSIVVNTDGSYTLLGTKTVDNNSLLEDLFIAKVSNNGDKQWEKQISITNNQIGKCIKQSNDGGYIIVGSTTANNNTDVFLIRTDQAGDTLWTKKFGGIYDDVANDVLQKSDDGFIVIGSTKSFPTLSQNNNVIVLETNANGIISNAPQYSQLEGAEGQNIKALPDGSGYMLTGTMLIGENGKKDVFLAKINSNISNLEWKKDFGGSADDIGNALQITNDNEIAIIGTTESYNDGSKDMFFIKTDNAGNEIVTQTFGGAGIEEGNNICNTLNNGFIIIGSSEVEGNKMICLVKVDELGNLN
ncbi:MAG: hypothetical protein DRJ01_03900 [Bacteroidetes bacterium]|nr:MAG: hypothetical protein DRJ01_03900 [Bacteroidota bacterium]